MNAYAQKTAFAPVPKHVFELLEPGAPAAETAGHAPHADAAAVADATEPVERADAGSVDSLRDYAYIKSWNAALQDLARLAAPRSWDRAANALEGRPAMPLGLLSTYLNVVFTMAVRRDLLVETENGRHAVLNTGLVSRFGLPILMVFSFDPCVWHKDWRFEGFFEPGCGLGSVVLRELSGRLPAAPAAERPAYDPEKPIYLDFHHMVRSRAYRLPASLLAGNEVACTARRALGKLDDEAREADRRELVETITRAVKEDDALGDGLRARIADALAATLSLWSRREDTVAVRYDAPRDETACLIPLWLTGSREPDVVLIASDLGSCYQASTFVAVGDVEAGVLAAEHRLPWWLDDREPVPAEARAELGLSSRPFREAARAVLAAAGVRAA